MPAITPRTAIIVALALASFWFITPTHIFPLYSDSSIPLMIAESLGSYGETDTHHSSNLPSGSSPSSLASSAAASAASAASAADRSFSPAEIYFDQAFSLNKPHNYDFPALRRQCDQTAWRNTRGDGSASVYLQCEGIYLGLTSVISQVKSCFKMAIEAGVGVVLPSIPLRDANNLLVYNQGNHAAERAFGDWFDEMHFVDSMAHACPGLGIMTSNDLETGRMKIQEEDKLSIDIHAARFFRERDGYFWAGKPFKSFFDETFDRMREEKEEEKGKKLKDNELEDKSKEPESQLQGRAAGGEEKPAILVSMRADFELFNVANDPTGHERHMWDDLGRALRFLHEPRVIVDEMLRQINGPFFAVHFRGEGDNMWASPEEQIHVDLDALDRVWDLYQDVGDLSRLVEANMKPPVYLACGDEGSIQAFVDAGKARGWNVTSKYALAKAMEDAEIFDMIEGLPFDFQAIIDLGLSVASYFFIGIMGSAFSYTTANLRDPLTRYRGSSFEMWDDGGARTHMFPNNDRHGDTTMEKYACCL